MTDTGTEDLPQSPPPASWATVVEAAEHAGVDTGIVRRWYRSGRIPTRRGDRGAFLVPVEAVKAMAAELMELEDAGPAPLAEDTAAAEVTYWALQAASAREEAESARQEAVEAEEERRAAEEQLEFLRSQLAEVSEENRNLREQLDTLRAESATAGSVTDFSWLQNSRAYESPVRPQVRMGTALSGLLADVQPDEPIARAPGADEDDGLPSAPFATEDLATVGPHAEAIPGLHERPEDAAPGPVFHDYGYNEDDLLPDVERKGRRRG